MDRKKLSKSAPSYVKRKGGNEADKKVTTIRDVNQWVQRGNGDQMNRKNARNIGLLTENVTEERMLYAKQMELGRERYKFLANHYYEKQKFIERQNLKHRSMKKAMASARKEIEKSKHQTPKLSITVRIPQADEASLSNDTDKEDATSVTGLRHGSRSTKSEISGGGTKGVTLPKSRQFGNQTPKLSKRAFYICTSNSTSPRETKTQTETGKREDKLPSVKVYDRSVSFDTKRVSGISSRKADPSNFHGIARRVSGKSQTHESSNTNGIATMTSNVSSAGVNVNPRYTSSVVEVAESLQSTRQWAVQSRVARKMKYGQKFDSSVADPRYVALTNTLIPLVDKPVKEVKDIIARKESLRVGSVSEKNGHSKKMHAKFIAMLLEKELSVR